MRRNSQLAAIAGFALAAILFVAGGLLLWGSTYTHNMVHNQLAAQQIFHVKQHVGSFEVASSTSRLITMASSGQASSQSPQNMQRDMSIWKRSG